MEEVSDYEPSKELLQAFKADFTDESLTAIGTTFASYLKEQQLDYDNICKVLITLLSIEDISTMKDYVQLGQSNVRFFKNNRTEFYVNLRKTQTKVTNILNPRSAEVVLVPRNSSTLAIDNILALLPHPDEKLICGEENHRHLGKITNVSRQRVFFKPIDHNRSFNKNYKLCKTFPKTVLLEPHDVIFRPLRIAFRLMCRALEELEKCSLTRRYLFPIPNIEKQASVAQNLPTLDLFNKAIASNAEQLQAVQQIVAGPNPQAPYILFGPPGTGKTTTIVEAILQLYLREGTRIIVTAGSNSACETVALRICEMFACSERLPKPVEYPLNNNKVDPSPTKLIRIYALSFNMRNVDPTLEQYFNCTRLASEDYKAGIVDKYKIIVGTLCSVARMVIYHKSRFTHVFIDEAAASTEGEALMGIVGIKDTACHVMLSGDHKQLGAVIKSNRAGSLGLGQSLMERLLLNKLYKVDASGDYDRSLQTRLRRNYRSHPEIVGIYNKLYYNGELIPLAPLAQVSQAAKWRVLPNGKFPVLFQATHGTTERDGHSTSSFNKQEAEVLCWYVRTLLMEGLGDGVKVKPQDIGVVTPYLAQCGLLKRMLSDRNLWDVEVGTVESYQGREKLIIIVSLVSSFRAPLFLSNAKRVNVLLSRAKSLMILIGNPISLGENNDFKFIIDQCKLQQNFLTTQPELNGSNCLGDYMKKLSL